MEGKELKEWNLYLLQAFFAVPYEEGDFYMQFGKRYEEARKRLDS